MLFFLYPLPKGMLFVLVFLPLVLSQYSARARPGSNFGPERPVARGERRLRYSAQDARRKNVFNAPAFRYGKRPVGGRSASWRNADGSQRSESERRRAVLQRLALRRKQRRGSWRDANNGLRSNESRRNFVQGKWNARRSARNPSADLFGRVASGAQGFGDYQAGVDAWGASRSGVRHRAAADLARKAAEDAAAAKAAADKAAADKAAAEAAAAKAAADAKAAAAAAARPDPKTHWGRIGGSGGVSGGSGGVGVYQLTRCYDAFNPRGFDCPR